MKRWRTRLVSTAIFASAVAVVGWSGCSANSSSSTFGTGGSGGGGGSVDAGPDGSMFGCNTCISGQFQRCDDMGNPTTPQDCAPLTCVPGIGCAQCTPGANTCVGNEVHACKSDGTPGDLVQTCDPAKGEVCGNGKCGSECDVLAGSGSYVGCEFWAVDLPNERGMNDAADMPWGVAIVNAGQSTATVNIEMNVAPYGQAPQTQVVQSVVIDPSHVAEVELPSRELTGYYKGQADPPGPPSTLVTSNAFRITSSSPLIVTQFNVFNNSFSNDASLLLPRAALGTLHRVVGYSAANPVVIPGTPPLQNMGIPDHTAISVVGVAPNTHVKVKLAADILGNASQSIPEAKKGDTVDFTIGPFDVVNLASRSDCATLAEIPNCLGDQTGAIVQSDQPVEVFFSTERSLIAPPGASSSSNACCTDHLEEEIFPVTALGKHFVITKSPSRGGSEPDVLRFLGVAEPATITTTLPPPDDSFTLQPGEMREVASYGTIAADSSVPIMIAQLLVSQSFTADYIGDPDLTVFPPTEQYRKDYTFLCPGHNWTKNYVAIATPEGNNLLLDGAALPADCQTVPGPTSQGVKFDTIYCGLQSGAHRVEGDKDFGITVHGYGSAGSYSFVGGAEVKQIYTPPPLL